MKKLRIFLCFLLILTGCSGRREKAPAAEDCIWQMTTVQSVEAEGQAIAYGPGWNNASDTGEQIRLRCIAADGVLTLVDETNGQTYCGTYQLTQTDRQTSFYEVKIGETEGAAVTSMTTYHDESQTPTFIIRLEDYALNFFPAESE